MSTEERLDRIDRTTLLLDQRMNQVLATLSDMAKGWEVLGGLIGDIHEACCGEKPPSELADALRQLASAVDRQGDRIQTLVERLSRMEAAPS